MKMIVYWSYYRNGHAQTAVSILKEDSRFCFHKAKLSLLSFPQHGVEIQALINLSII